MSGIFEAVCGDLPDFAQNDSQDESFITLEKLGLGRDDPLYPTIQGLAERGYLRFRGQPPAFHSAQICEFLTRYLFIRLPQDHPIALILIMMDLVSLELAASKNEALRLRRTQDQETHDQGNAGKSNLL